MPFLLMVKMVEEAALTTLKALPVPPPSSHTVKAPVAVEVPTATFPPAFTTKCTTPVELATVRIESVVFVVSTRNAVSPVEFSTTNAEVMSVVVLRRVPVVPETERRKPGLVVPIPKFPLSKTVSRSVLAESASTNKRPVPVPLPVRDSLAEGVVVPMPTLPVPLVTKYVLPLELRMVVEASGNVEARVVEVEVK